MSKKGTSVNTNLSKPLTSGTKLYSVTSLPKSKVIPKVVEKNDSTKSVTSHLNTKKIIEECTKVLAPGLLKIESEPINVYLKNNKPYVDPSRTKQTIETITKEHAVKQNTQKTDNTMLPSTGRVSSTNASGSKPRSNTKNDKILQPSSRSMKNKDINGYPLVGHLTWKENRAPSSSNDTSTIVVPPGHILTTTVIPVVVQCPKLSLRYANAR
ncbi:hypothetical protein Tco_0480702 [Tanacetum coccineum]